MKDYKLQENEKNLQKKRKFKHPVITGILLVMIFLIVVLGVGFGCYVGNYYHADEAAKAAFTDLPENIEQYSAKVAGENVIVFSPEDPVGGLIFYPGAKVECEAYGPLMRACAEKGILCVLVKMPFNLAVFDIEAADGIPDAFPEVENWCIGGHSLGGAMASICVSKHPDEFKGLVLLAAYSSTDLSETGVSSLCIYGSEDGVMNRTNYEKYRSNLGENTEERIIEGGCHSYFGSYGMQKGDGNPTITGEEQREETASIIAEFYSRLL